MNGSLYAVLLYFVIYLQDVLGYSALGTGLRVAILSLAQLVTSVVAGRVSERVPTRWLIGPGLLLVGVGLLVMTGLTGLSDWTHLIPGFIVGGLGAGLVNPPLASTAIGVVPPAKAGMASGRELDVPADRDRGRDRCPGVDLRVFDSEPSDVGAACFAGRVGGVAGERGAAGVGFRCDRVAAGRVAGGGGAGAAVELRVGAERAAVRDGGGGAGGGGVRYGADPAEGLCAAGRRGRACWGGGRAGGGDRVRSVCVCVARGAGSAGLFGQAPCASVKCRRWPVPCLFSTGRSPGSMEHRVDVDRGGVVVTDPCADIAFPSLSVILLITKRNHDPSVSPRKRQAGRGSCGDGRDQ